MCSASRAPERAWIVALLALLLMSCERERREVDPQAPGAPALTQSALRPGGAMLPVANEGAHYERNAYHINEGQRLYRTFNCNGCHANGGGDIGPALMDSEWRYGGDIEHIYASIAEGRPNGMPSFAGKVPDAQIWQIAAYVRSLSGNVPKSAAPSRGETISATPPLTRMPKQPPVGGDTHESKQ
jgi:cytochrome c oxidase cbb3-type subunit 3